MKKYTYQYNPARKVWTVWKQVGWTSEVVKSFKSERAAEKYCDEHNR